MISLHVVVVPWRPGSAKHLHTLAVDRGGDGAVSVEGKQGVEALAGGVKPLLKRNVGAWTLKTNSMHQRRCEVSDGGALVLLLCRQCEWINSSLSYTHTLSPRAS